jgi:hypothetical protein
MALNRDPVPITGADKGVSIEHIDGKWAVQIVEAGEVSQHMFETEEWALNFAAGQRMRLGIKTPQQPIAEHSD